MTSLCPVIRKSAGIVGLLLLVSGMLHAQSADDALRLKEVYQTTLRESRAYEWLAHLSEEIGGRLAGSEAADQAIQYTRRQLADGVADRAWLQPCMVPVWKRGEPEEVYVTRTDGSTRDLRALALGNCTATPQGGVEGQVIEVFSLDEVDSLGSLVAGKIVFYNRPMDPAEINPFYAYGKAVDQRVYGPAKAAKYGAVAVLVRSMTTNLDDVPHTGVTVFPEDQDPIAAVGIATNDAEWLSAALAEDPGLEVYVRTDCKILPPARSANVIGEIRGSTHPDEIILVGGHLDSWDVGGGAHDDGSGCVQAMDVLHMLRVLDYQPKRTIRCVLFMNEENGLGGGRAYADSARSQNTFHLAAIESDAGGFTPRGFSCEADADVFTPYYRKLNEWLPLLEPYGLQLMQGGSGADISPLKFQKGLLVGLRPDPQRYFDYHHTDQDRIQAVNPRELALGTAAMTSLVLLIDQYGLGN